jgi:hypothetical protein
MIHVTSVLQQHKDRDLAHHNLGRAALAVPVSGAPDGAAAPFSVAIIFGAAVAAVIV